MDGRPMPGTATAYPQRDFRFQFRLFHGLQPRRPKPAVLFLSVATATDRTSPAAEPASLPRDRAGPLSKTRMVEAQQARLDESAKRTRRHRLRCNRMHMRRMVERRIAEEQRRSRRK